MESKMKRPKRNYNEHILPYLERVEKYVDGLEQQFREECDAHARTLKRLEEK